MPTAGLRSIPRWWSGRSRNCSGPAGDAVRIHYGCDFHLTPENIEDAIAAPGKYSIDHQGYILVELSDSMVPRNIDSIFTRMLAAGLRPIITHPERNPLYTRSFLSWSYGSSKAAGAGNCTIVRRQVREIGEIGERRIDAAQPGPLPGERRARLYLSLAALDEAWGTRPDTTGKRQRDSCWRRTHERSDRRGPPVR